MEWKGEGYVDLGWEGVSFFVSPTNINGNGNSNSSNSNGLARVDDRS